MCIAADRYELTETTSQRTSQSLSGPCAAPMRAPPHASFRPIKQTVGCCCINVTLGNHLSGYTKPVLNRLRLFATLNRIADIAYPWGLDMRRVRFPALSAASFAAVAAAFLFSVSAAHAQCLPSQGSNSATASSWVAGGQAGYDWQQGSFVYGVETDLSGTGLKSSMSGGLSGGSCTTDTANTSADVDWYGTVRGRAGWTTDKVLFYGTGGLAYGSVDLNSNFSTAGLSVNSQTSSIRTGWVAGGGIEYMVQPNLISDSWVPVCRSRNSQLGFLVNACRHNNWADRQRAFGISSGHRWFGLAVLSGWYDTAGISVEAVGGSVCRRSRWRRVGERHERHLFVNRRHFGCSAKA